MKTIGYQETFDRSARIITVAQGAYGLAGTDPASPVKYVGTFGIGLCTGFALVAKSRGTSACRVVMAHAEAFASVENLPSKVQIPMKPPADSSFTAFIVSMANTKHAETLQRLMDQWKIQTYADTGNNVSALVIDLNSGLPVDPDEIPETSTLLADPRDEEWLAHRLGQAALCAQANVPGIDVIIQRHFDTAHGIPEHYRPVTLHEYLAMQPF